MKKLILLVTLLVMILGLGSCISRPHTQIKEYNCDVVYLTPVFEQFEFGNIQVTDTINLRFLVGVFPGAGEYFQCEYTDNIEIIWMNYLYSYDSLVEFCEFDHQYRSGLHKLAFVFNADVTDFQWVLMDHIPGDGRNINFIVDAIYSIDALKANQPFVTTYTWRGHEPARGISFVDNYSNTRVFVFGACEGCLLDYDCLGWHINEFLDFKDLRIYQ